MIQASIFIQLLGVKHEKNVHDREDLGFRTEGEAPSMRMWQRR